MRPLRLALIADGSSDRALVPIVLWHVRRRMPGASFSAVDFDTHDRRDMAGGMQRMALRMRPDILLVHRDAEREPLAARRLEIPDVAPPARRVRLVPVRMTEAWLLLEERAIRIAAQNPNGRVPLELPELHRLESLPEPKALLHDH